VVDSSERRSESESSSVLGLVSVMALSSSMVPSKKPLMGVLLMWLWWLISAFRNLLFM